LVLSAQEVLMTSRMRLRASSEVAEGVEVLADLVEGVVGVQR
jgi:hypothetical protein